jgi:hypothetical protein
MLHLNDFEISNDLRELTRARGNSVLENKDLQVRS